MVHLEYASIALGAVVTARCLEDGTPLAVLQALFIFCPLRSPSYGYIARSVEDGSEEVEKGGHDEAAVEAQVEQVIPPPQGH